MRTRREALFCDVRPTRDSRRRFSGLATPLPKELRQFVETVSAASSVRSCDRGTSAPDLQTPMKAAERFSPSPISAWQIMSERAEQPLLEELRPILRCRRSRSPEAIFCPPVVLVVTVAQPRP